jgi:imidazolonepropionase-like amidohydrolase
VAKDVAIPGDYTVVDARGHWITPGIIDMHSHNGAGSSPNVDAHSDFNEEARPIGAENWVEHSLWPFDPNFRAAREAGVTTLMILPGSASPIGGRTVVVKNVPARTAYQMKFPNAPQGLKVACGENPKRVWGARGIAPGTRMGEMAVLRQALADAQRYQLERKNFERSDQKGLPPRRDLQMETLAALLNGQLAAHIHCYRSDDMVNMIELSKEFDFRIAAFHHATDAYKIRDILKARGICVATWTDRWGAKMEMLDGIRETPSMIDADGGCVAMHSDSEITGQRLNQEAGKAMAAGRRMNIDISPARAVRWLTLNPARAIGIDAQTGTLEAGKMADLVVWNRNPFSNYALAELVLIDGAVVFDRSHPTKSPPTDVELGATRPGGSK